MLKINNSSYRHENMDIIEKRANYSSIKFIDLYVTKWLCAWKYLVSSYTKQKSSRPKKLL